MLIHIRMQFIAQHSVTESKRSMPPTVSRPLHANVIMIIPYFLERPHICLDYMKAMTRHISQMVAISKVDGSKDTLYIR